MITEKWTPEITREETWKLRRGRERRGCNDLASPANILRGSSRVLAPLRSADWAGKNVDQSQQTSRSGKCTLDRLTVFSHRRRKRLSSTADHLFRSEFSDCRQNRSFGDKSIVFLHFPRKLRAGQLGLLSISFDFRNVIFQPVVFPFVWAK